MDDTGFESPFNGDFVMSRARVLPFLGVECIENQPVIKAEVIFVHEPGYVIEAGDGKHYGLGFIEYCRQKCGCTTEGVLTIALPMVCEAILYYGLPLWNDTMREHLSIIPFRRALAGEDVRVKIYQKSDR